jgi:uncharacterized membrane protein
MSYFSFLKQIFLTGLYIILPIVISSYIIKIALNFLYSFILSLESNFYFLTIYNIKYSELISILLIIFLIGLIIKYTKLEDTIISIEKKIIQHIPIIKTIYNGIKKIITLIKFNKNDTKKINQVVWAKLPKLNMYCIGFMIGELEEKYTPEHDKKYFSIFIPTTPNPMTGYYIIAAEGEFIHNTMSREEALSIIISGGIIRPE